MKAALLGAAIWGLAFNANANAQDDQPFRLLALQGQYVKWGASATSGGTVVTYAFATARVTVPGARNCGEIGPIAGLLSKSNITEGLFRKEAEAAFAMWQAAANIRFSEISDPATAGIVIGAQVAPTGRAFANVSHHASNGPVAEIERAQICLNPDTPWKVGFNGNVDVYDLRYAIAHEIGHAIGLDHPQTAQALMSYKYNEQFRELQQSDRAGAVALYGARDLKHAAAQTDAWNVLAAAHLLSLPAPEQ